MKMFNLFGNFFFDFFQISFKDYVERNHGVTITNADPPMLISVAKRKDEMGDRYVALIPEFCHITGLTDVLKENEKLMADVLETEKLFNEQNVTTFFDRISGRIMYIFIM